MGNKQVIYILLAFVSGFLVNALLMIAYAPHKDMSNTEFEPLSSSATSDLERLEVKLDSIIATLKSSPYSESLHDMAEVSVTVEDNDEQSVNSDVSMTADKPDYRSQEDISYIKSEILTSIYNDGYTINELVTSDSLNSLSDADKKEVLDELARRMDSGEIELERFLPGYVR